MYTNFLKTIKNHILIRKNVKIKIKYTNNNINIIKILLKKDFIECTRIHKEKTKCFLILTLKHKFKIFLKFISKPSVRIYSNYKQIYNILNNNRIGIIIISTSIGIITEKEASIKKIGGELLFKIW
uniref:ribosomal protein S8 n=1 Tax=Pogoniopsis schenckii TaxID=1582014 RepID=UPI0022387E24|nr:ribosomal protein S8 [Pogoniopsis schenckii]UYP51007.1 ribosomal protein S8 [Pogoniopsis schenckii]